MPITILVAPSGFKECLSPTEVTEAIAAGALRAMSDARILRAPMPDGGEGFTETLVKATGGTMRHVGITGPVGQPVPSFFGFLGGGRSGTAVIEIAAAAGLRLVPRGRRDPTRTTSFGVGELIRAALDVGAERLLIGCGDSGVNDGGAGMAQALGVRFLDSLGRDLGPGGRELNRLARIDCGGLDPRIRNTPIDVAVNWHNVLLGEQGVARVFGPQKGATREQVGLLEAGLKTYARCISEATGHSIGQQPGCGASGGLGAALMALLGATLHPRFHMVMQHLQFDDLLREADLVITAEGSLDGQSPLGKIPCEVARRAKRRGIPVIALAGTIGDGVRETFAHGIDAFSSILTRPCTLDEAIVDARSLLAHGAEDALRMVAIGIGLEVRRAAAHSGAPVFPDCLNGLWPASRLEPGGQAQATVQDRELMRQENDTAMLPTCRGAMGRRSAIGLDRTRTGRTSLAGTELTSRGSRARSGAGARADVRLENLPPDELAADAIGSAYQLVEGDGLGESVSTPSQSIDNQ